jgi:tRNA(Ile)-lysidine synthase
MLESKVAALLKRHSFQLENKNIVVAVSGGPDSLALLHYLRGLKKTRNIAIVAAHVDHMFRGQESLEDAQFVRSFCEDNAIPFELERINVPKIIEQTGINPQTAARQARYQFFADVMEKYGYEYLALGHHGDDQIETILMRLTKGSTGAARAGIPFSRPFSIGSLFRPFLGLTKAEINDYCCRFQLEPRVDPSNKKDTYTRNRFRKEIIPFLKAENVHVHEHFQRFSEEIQIDELFLQELTVQTMNTVMETREKDKITIDINRFLEVPIPLQRRGIQLILNYLYKVKPASLSALHIDQIFSLIQNPHPSGTLDFPIGLKIIRSYKKLSFLFDISATLNYFFTLNEPGVIELPNGTSVKMSIIKDGNLHSGNCMAIFSADTIKLPLVIRTRRNGDRMSLKGMAGTKKLKDIFIDNKIPIQDRDSWPVITDSDGGILWLPGLKKASFEGMDDPANQYIQLIFHK